jgi:diaminopimelate decarboxylase
MKINKNLSINLGGGISNLTIEGIKSLFEFSQKELSRHKIYIEPGRYLTENVAKCFSEVVDISDEGDSLIVNLNISRECHLKWSRVRGIQILKGSSSRTYYKSKRIYFYGNTCFENDLIGSCDYEVAQEVGIGDKVILSNISGYSLAWNHSFNGIAPIDIAFE